MTPLSPEKMVKVVAIAPFEIAEALACWSERARADADLRIPPVPGSEEIAMLREAEEESKAWADGFGVPTPYGGETDRAFGERCAAAIFHFLKEI